MSTIKNKGDKETRDNKVTRSQKVVMEE